IGGDLAISGGNGSSTFAQFGHALNGVRGGWGGLAESGGYVVGEAEWYTSVLNWVQRPEGFYPENPGGTAPPPATFSGSRNGWFMELADGLPIGSPGAADGSYLLYRFTTGSDGGNY